MNGIILLTIGLLLSTLARAGAVSGNVAVITRLSGNVTVLRPESTGSPAAGAKISFEGEHCTEIAAKPGTQLLKGDLLKTGPNSQTRLIFKNGDSMSIGPETAYKISWKKDDSSPIIDVFYGKLRGVFKKDGPRSGTVVQTKTSVMGVRGTDFYVAAHAGTEVSVLRGEVELQPQRPGAKPIALQTGFTAKIPASVAPPAPPPAAAPGETQAAPKPQPSVAADDIVVAPTSKEELVEIQTESTVKPTPPPAIVPSKDQDSAISDQKAGEVTPVPDSEPADDLAALEKQSVETVMEDIKVTDPRLYEQIASNKQAVKDFDNVNKVAVGELFKKAPEERSPTKPGQKELDGLGKDAYDRYFKVE